MPLAGALPKTGGQFAAWPTNTRVAGPFSATAVKHRTQRGRHGSGGDSHRSPVATIGVAAGGKLGPRVADDGNPRPRPPNQ